jgi:hypothetical protein
MKRYRPRKTDTTHAKIGKALRSVTEAIDVHAFGPIGADWLARHVVTGQPMLIEAKSDKKTSHRAKDKLTANEALMSVLFPDNWRRCETEEEALAAVGATPRVV